METIYGEEFADYVGFMIFAPCAGYRREAVNTDDTFLFGVYLDLESIEAVKTAM